MLGISAETLLIGELNPKIWTTSHSRDTFYLSYTPELKGAPRHYAMSVAYYMINPNEPYEGENVVGEPNYAFNPYLEAGFGPGVFDTTLSYISTPLKEKIPTYAGVRTNCMSCHRMASVDPDSISSSQNAITPYVGNAYISRADPLFDGQLLLDFAWSVQGNVDTTGIKSFINKYTHKDK